MPNVVFTVLYIGEKLTFVSYRRLPTSYAISPLDLFACVFLLQRSFFVRVFYFRL